MKCRYLFATLILFLSCSESNKPLLFYQKVIDEMVVVDGYEKMLIIPSVGCQGCITSAEQFLRKNYGKYKKTFVVLTGIYSKKVLKQKLGNEVLEQSNIYLDFDNRFMKMGDANSIYPAIINLEKGVAKSIEYLSPMSDKNLLDSLDVY